MGKAPTLKTVLDTHPRGRPRKFTLRFFMAFFPALTVIQQQELSRCNSCLGAFRYLFGPSAGKKKVCTTTTVETLLCLFLFQGLSWERPDLLQSPEMARPAISTKNTEKILPGPKFWTPRIYLQNTPKIPKKYPKNTKNAHFGYFFGVFSGYFLGVQNFAPERFFWVFFVEIPGRAISELCSRSGHSQGLRHLRCSFPPP